MGKTKKRKNFRLPNGAGTVYKLGGNRRKPFAAVMSVGYTDDGILKRKYIGYYETYEEALHALELYKETPFDLEKKNITVRELYNLLMERKKDKSIYTQRNYITAYNHIKSIANRPIREIRTHDLQRIMDSANIKATSKQHIKQLLHSIFEIAIEYDFVKKDYSHYIAMETAEKSTMHQPFTVLEIRKLWEISKTDRFAELPLILIYTGMRPQEMLRILRQNVHLDEQYIIGGMKTRAGTNRVIPIHSAILPIIERRLHETSEFLIEDGGKKIRYGKLLYHWNTFMEQNGLSHKPHDGRHTFISLAKSKNMDTVILKRIVGHTSQDITEDVYTHKSISELVQAVNSL